MINEFSVKVKSTNNKAKYIFFITLIAAAVIFAVSFTLEKYSGLVGNAALIILVVSILFYTKYVSPEYYYDIMIDSDGAPIFVVRMMSGKRQSTLCRIGLAEIIKMEREDPAARRANKVPTGVRVYSYCPTFMPEVTYRLHTRSRYERAQIIIEITDEFSDLLRQYIAEAHRVESELDDE